jgi:hypothetical protein
MYVPAQRAFLQFVNLHMPPSHSKASSQFSHTHLPGWHDVCEHGRG